MTTHEQTAYAAHLAQYSDLDEVRSAGEAWFALTERIGFRKELTRDERRLKARYEKVLTGTQAAPTDQEADPP